MKVCSGKPLRECLLPRFRLLEEGPEVRQIEGLQEAVRHSGFQAIG
jgi:hypothetical protein